MKENYNAEDNMTARLPYAYTTRSTFPYEYSNSVAPLYISYSASNGWCDQMTSYNGNTITYDGAGNILSYNNGASMTLTWTQGNRLASVNRAGTTSSYLYDENGYLMGIPEPDPEHPYPNIFYSGITRVREHLALVIMDAPELLENILSILD